MFKRRIVFLAIALFVIFPVLNLALVSSVGAQTVDLETELFKKGKVDEGGYDIGAATGLGDKDPREVAAQVINIVLGFLGIIAVILILVGGFMWMTAAGNEDKVGTAKKLMMAGAVGLIIVLAAFGIAKFVISALMGATGAT